MGRRGSIPGPAESIPSLLTRAPAGSGRGVCNGVGCVGRVCPCVGSTGRWGRITISSWCPLCPSRADLGRTSSSSESGCSEFHALSPGIRSSLLKTALRCSLREDMLRYKHPQPVHSGSFGSPRGFTCSQSDLSCHSSQSCLSVILFMGCPGWGGLLGVGGGAGRTRRVCVEPGPPGGKGRGSHSTRVYDCAGRPPSRVFSME